MNINIARTLINLDGTPLLVDPAAREENRQIWTVGSVFITCLLSAPPAGQTYAPADSVSRYQLALDIQNMLSLIRDGIEGDEEVAVTVEMAVKLKADIARMFGPLVGGQVIPLLDGE